MSDKQKGDIMNDEELFYQKIANAWIKWDSICDEARSTGYAHLIEELPENTGFVKIDKAIAALRRAMEKEARDTAIPADHRRGRSVLFKK